MYLFLQVFDMTEVITGLRKEGPVITIPQPFDTYPPRPQQWLREEGIGKQVQVKCHLLRPLLILMATPCQLLQDKLSAAHGTHIALRIT